MTELDVALIAAVVGGVVSWATTWDQARRDRTRQRKALATALLVDLRSAEATARTAYEHHRRVFPPRRSGFAAFATPPETLARVFTPRTVDLVMHVAALTGELLAALDLTRDPEVGFRAAAPDRVAAAAHLLATRIAPLRDALEREGGHYVHAAVPMTTVKVGDLLPPLPPSVFPTRGAHGDSDAGALAPVAAGEAPGAR